MKYRLDIIDIAKGIAILLVVASHAIQKCEGSPHNPMQQLICIFHMPFFFALAGYLRGEFDAGAFSLKKIFISRFFRLALPYLLWVAVLITCDFLTWRHFSFEYMLHQVLWSDFWFLRVLFIILILNAFSFSICLKMKWLNYNAWITELICITLASVIHYASRASILNYYFCFLIGRIVFYCVKNESKFATRVVCLILAMFYCVGAIGYLSGFCELNRYIRHILSFPGCCLVLVLSHVVDISSRWMTCVKNFFIFCGKNSLAIYAVHWCLFFYLIPLPPIASLYGGYWKALSMGIVFLVWVLLTLLIVRALQLSKIGRLMVGVSPLTR